MEKRKYRVQKKFILCLIVMAVVAGPLAAQDGLGWWGSYYTPGNISAGVLLGASFDPGFSLDVYPNVERKFFKWRPANLFAVDFGIGARGALNFYTGTGDAWNPGHIGIGAGPYISWHFGFRGFGELGVPGLEYLERLDLFWSLGLNYQIYMGDNPPNSGLFFSNLAGFNFFLNDNLALTVSTIYNNRLDSYYYYRSGFTGGIGVTLKFGPKERLTAPPSLGEPVYIYFQAYYMMALGFSAGFYDDQTFQVGDETTFRFTYSEAGESRDLDFNITRTLLHRAPDGRRSWWRLEFQHPDMDKDSGWPYEFEVLANEHHDVIRVRYIDPNTGQLTMYDPDDPAEWRRHVDYDQWDKRELEDYYVRTESVQVSAGTFEADVYFYGEENFEYTVWISEEAPGALIKLDGITSDDQRIEGELMRIRRGVSSPWTPAW